MHAKEFLPCCRTCAKNSNYAIRILNEFKKISNNYFITAYDTEVACPNVKTEEGLELLILSLEDFMFKAQDNWPKRQLLLAIRILLK